MDWCWDADSTCVGAAFEDIRGLSGGLVAEEELLELRTYSRKGRESQACKSRNLHEIRTPGDS